MGLARPKALTVFPKPKLLLSYGEDRGFLSYGAKRSLFIFSVLRGRSSDHPNSITGGH